MTPEESDGTTALGLFRQVSMPSQSNEALAVQAEELGWSTLWVNSPPGADPFPPLAGIAHATKGISLGTGVLPTSEWPSSRILDRMTVAGLPMDRIRLGIGGGHTPHPAPRLAKSLHDLREATDVSLIVGGMGARVLQVAAQQADGVLLNALTPDATAETATRVRRIAADARRPVPRVAVLIIVGIGGAGAEAVEATARFYLQIPAYRAHFDRLAVDPLDVMLRVREVGELPPYLEPWRQGVDEVVISVEPASDTTIVARALDTISAQWLA